MHKLTIVCLVVWCLLVGIIHGQEAEAVNKSGEQNAIERDRTLQYETIVYPARSAAVSTLTKALAEFFKDSTTQVTAEPNSKLLLIRVEAAHRAELLALLSKLDPSPRAISVQIHLLKTDGANLEDEDTALLTGPTAAALKKIRELQSRGQIHVANQLEFSAVENQRTILQIGRRLPVLSGSTLTRTGVSNAYRFEQVGTLISLIAQASDDGGITIQLQFEKSEINENEKTDEDDKQPKPPSTSTLTHQTTVHIRDGHSVLVGKLLSRLQGKSEEAYLVVSAKLGGASVGGNSVSFRSLSESGFTGSIPRASSSRVRSSPAVRRESSPARRPSPAARGNPSSRDRAEIYEKYAKALIAKYDMNRDGVLTKDEWKSMTRDPSPSDGDGDGKITVAEFVQWYLNRRRE